MINAAGGGGSVNLTINVESRRLVGDDHVLAVELARLITPQLKRIHYFPGLG